MPSPIATVFIPALLCDEALYADVIASLGERIDARVMSAPQPSLADSAADILASAPAEFVLAGTSYGGRLALEVALAAPGRVRALWLMGCDPGAAAPGGPDLAAGLRSTPDAVIDLLAGLVVRQEAVGPARTFKAMARRIGAAAGAAQARAIGERADIGPRLGELTMPALVLWGEDDTLVPVAVGRELASRLPRATFHTLPDCGHLPTLEQPAQSAARFGAFLRDAGLATA